MLASEMAEFMSQLTGAYPRMTITEPTARTYAQLLGDLECGAALAALLEHVTESPHFPAISDIRQRAARKAAGCPDPDQAWAEVTCAFSTVGSYGTPKWSHPAIKAAMDALGWRDLCGSNSADLATWRAQFRGFYEAACTRAQRVENVGRLGDPSIGRPVLAGNGAALKALKGGTECERPVMRRHK